VAVASAAWVVPRYVMLETLRAYGARLLAQAGEQPETAAALAGYALGVAEEAAAGLQTSTGELAAARRLDAESANVRQVLAWAVDHDPAVALRLAVALAPWWFLRGRLAGQYPLLLEAADRAVLGSDGWCAAQYWLGVMALYSSDHARALGHCTAVRDAMGICRRPGCWPTAWPSGRGSCPTWAGSPRPPRMPAVPGPWPASSATRPVRHWPWYASPSPPFLPTTWVAPGG
jgi:hypothetical protein